MTTAFGSAMLLTGFCLLVAANVVYWKLREQLVRKRPELMDYVFGGWWWFGKYKRLESVYKAEFPESERIHKMYVLGISAVVLGVAGLLLLTVK